MQRVASAWASIAKDWELLSMSDTLAFDTLSTAMMCQSWRYSILILCFLYLGLIICYHMDIALSH